MSRLNRLASFCRGEVIRPRPHPISPPKGGGVPPPPAPPGPAVLWSCSRPVGPPLPPFFEPHWAEVSVRVVVPRARPGNRYTYVSAHRCACHGMLRAVVLSTAHTLSIQPKSAAHIKLNTVTKVGIGVRAPPNVRARGVQSGRFRAHKVPRSCHASLSAVSLLCHEPLLREPSPKEAAVPVER